MCCGSLLKQLGKFFIAHLADPRFAAAQGHLRNMPLLLNHLIDFFFKGTSADKTGHKYGVALPDSKCAVGCLIFYRGVIPEVKVDNAGRGGKVQTGAACLERNKKDALRRIGLERFDCGLPCGKRHLTVQKEGFISELLLYQLPQQKERLRVLAEKGYPTAQFQLAKIYESNDQKEFAKKDIRAVVDARSEKIGLKIREAQLAKIPYSLIVGENEVNERTVSVRKRGEGDKGSMKFEAFLDKILEEVNSKVVK